jgi:hypothetical protein
VIGFRYHQNECTMLKLHQPYRHICGKEVSVSVRFDHPLQLMWSTRHCCVQATAVIDVCTSDSEQKIEYHRSSASLHQSTEQSTYTPWHEEQAQLYWIATAAREHKWKSFKLPLTILNKSDRTSTAAMPGTVTCVFCVLSSERSTQMCRWSLVSVSRTAL